MNTKRCTKCHEELALDHFYKQARGKYGRRSICKACQIKHVVAYQKLNPERKREKDRRSYQLHRTERLSASAEYRAANREEIRARDRVYAAAHSEEAKARAKKWYHEHRADALARDKARPKKPRNKKQAAEYRNSHREQRRVYSANRRARIHGCAGTITLEEWQALCDKYGQRCLKCGRTDVALTIDHVVPLAIGGSNLISNIQPLCETCNSHKHSATLDYR